MMRCGWTLSLVLLLAATATAQTKLTDHTWQLESNQPVGKLPIDELSWLAGSWQGEALGGEIEEVWLPAKDGTMLGMFRLVRDGKAAMYELLTLGQVDSSLSLKVKHFSPELVGWEAQDDAFEFRFIRREEGRFYFTGLTFEPQGPDRVVLYLAIQQGETGYREEVIRLKRVPTVQQP